MCARIAIGILILICEINRRVECLLVWSQIEKIRLWRSQDWRAPEQIQ